MYGKTYVLVVNGGEEPQEARIGLGGVCSAVVHVFGPKAGVTTVEGHSVLTLQLTPLETALYCVGLRPSGGSVL